MSTRIRHTTTTVRIRATGARTRVRNVQQVSRIRVGGVSAPIARGVKYLSRWPGTDRTGTTDCGTAVQAAIDAWAGTYKIVVDGTFKCTSEKLDLPSGTWLEAARWGVDGFTFGWTLASAGNYYLGNSTTNGTVNGIKLRGLKITGAGDGNPYGNATDPVNGVKLTSVYDSEVVGCTFYRCPGIALNHSGRANRYTDNDFRECGRDGITGFWRSELGLTDILVANNTFRLMGDDCIAVWAGAASVTNGTTATVDTTASSGDIVGTGTSWAAGDVGKRIAIYGAEVGATMYEGTITAVTDATHCTVSPQCNVTGSGLPAIYGFTRPSNITISGNVIEQNVSQDTYGGNRGINVGGCEGVTVTGNVVKGTHGQGIRVGRAAHSDYVFSRDVLVSGNTVLDAGQYAGSSGEYTGRRHGMEFDGTLSCTISGGTVARSYGKGVYVADSTNPTIVGLVVERNGTADDDYGIDFFGQPSSGRNLVTFPRVEGCTIRENKGAGVRFFHVRHGVVTGSTVMNNGQSGAGGADQAGILCTGSIGWVVTGCVITDTNPANRTQMGGIRVTNSGGTPYLIHWGNYLIGNSASSILLTNTSTICVGNSYESATASANPVYFPSGARILSGTSSPEGAITANVGSLYMRTDGDADTTLYVKGSGTGNTGWSALTDAASLGLGALATLSSVGAAQIDADAVGTSELAPDAVTGAELADDAVDSEHIVDRAVDPAHLALRTITTVSGATDTAAADQHMTVRSLTHGTGATVTLPQGIAAGVQIDYVAEGAGTYVFDDDGTSTIQPSGTLTIDGQYSWVTALSIGGNAWRLVGALV